MKHIKPSAVSIFEEQSDQDDPRVRNIVREYGPDGDFEICLVGVPFDHGVSLGKGRQGAKDGPDAIRRLLKRYGTAYNIEHKADIGDLRICDIGNVEVVENDTEETHARVSDVLGAVISEGMLPVVMGGGHDISFANVRGLCEAVPGHIGGINIDGHFDVRKVRDGKITSGTSFRRVLEELEGRVSGRNFVEIGAHDNLNSSAYNEYLVKAGAGIITLDQIAKGGIGVVMQRALKKAALDTSSIFASIDMDAMPQHIAPGCSAPSARGICADDIIEACFILGANGRLKLLDIMELNPSYDIDDRTALLAASMMVSFFSGYATRHARRAK